MVHYDPTLQAVPAPPMLCPKCGSHRTEIVGKSNDDAVLVVRCNVCGERSEIPNPDRRDGLTAEADAMAHIARVLSNLEGAESRTRVLRWALERTGVVEPDEDLAEVEAAEPAAHTPGDSSLAVEELSELFAGVAAGPSAVHAPSQATHGFVVGGDFRRRLRGGWLRA